MAREKLFHVGVKALIRNENQEYLLLKTSPRNHSDGTRVYWDMAGGLIDEEEGLIDAFYRELKEETGIIEISRPEFFTAVISNHEVIIETSRKVDRVLMVYTAEVHSGTPIKLSPEHTEYEWVGKREAAMRLRDKYPEEFTSKLNN